MRLSESPAPSPCICSSSGLCPPALSCLPCIPMPTKQALLLSQDLAGFRRRLWIIPPMLGMSGGQLCAQTLSFGSTGMKTAWSLGLTHGLPPAPSHQVRKGHFQLQVVQRLHGWYGTVSLTPGMGRDGPDFSGCFIFLFLPGLCSLSLV